MSRKLRFNFENPKPRTEPDNDDGGTSMDTLSEEPRPTLEPDNDDEPEKQGFWDWGAIGYGSFFLIFWGLVLTLITSIIMLIYYTMGIWGLSIPIGMVLFILLARIVGKKLQKYCES